MSGCVRRDSRAVICRLFILDCLHTQHGCTDDVLFLFSHYIDSPPRFPPCYRMPDPHRHMCCAMRKLHYIRMGADDFIFCCSDGLTDFQFGSIIKIGCYGH